MAVVLVQTDTKVRNSQSSSTNVPLTNTPISGNLLVSIISGDKDLGTVTQPTGFTLGEVIKADVSSTLAWAYKVSDGTETGDIRWTYTGSKSSQGCIYEISGLTATPFDVKKSANSGTSATTSQSTGTTATTAQADEYAIGMWSADTNTNVDGSRTYTNSFVENQFLFSGGSDGLIIALKTLSATGTVECTFGCTDTGDQMCGAVAVFKITTAAGTVVNCTTHALTLAEGTAEIVAAVDVNTTTHALTLTEGQAEIVAAVDINTATHALVLTEGQASIEAATVVNCTTHALTLTEGTATIDTAAGAIETTTHALVLAEGVASIEAATVVNCTTHALVLSANVASIITVAPSSDYSVIV